jgi:hypothetical protein
VSTSNSCGCINQSIFANKQVIQFPEIRDVIISDFKILPIPFYLTEPVGKFSSTPGRMGSYDKTGQICQSVWSACRFSASEVFQRHEASGEME